MNIEVGFYETGFVPVPFTIEEPPKPSAELMRSLRTMNANRVFDSLLAQDPDYFEHNSGWGVWERYFAQRDRPSIQSVLLLRAALSPKRR